MKYLNDKTAMKGDAVIYVTPAPDNFAVVGTVHELYDRNQNLRISGYPLQVPANKVLLAADGYAAVAGPIAEAAAKAEADKLATQTTGPGNPNSTPPPTP